MHHERGDLVEGDPIRPPGGKREDLVVRGEAVVAEAAEQPHHGEVELAMAAVGGRVDQPATPLGVDEAVASPEITVQPRRWLDGTTDVGQPTGERPQPIDRRWRQRARVGRQSGERQQATRAVELGPRRGGIIRQRPAPRRAAVLSTEARRAGSVQGGESPTEVLLGHTTGAAALDPRQHEQRRHLVRDRQHGRHVNRSRLTDPRQPRGFRREESRRRGAVRLDEHPATVDQLDAVGDGHIATGQRHPARYSGTECPLNSGDERPIHRWSLPWQLANDSEPVAARSALRMATVGLHPGSIELLVHDLPFPRSRSRACVPTPHDAQKGVTVDVLGLSAAGGRRTSPKR